MSGRSTTSCLSPQLLTPVQVQNTNRQGAATPAARSKSLMLKLSSSFTVKAEAALDPHRFRMFMMDLLAEHGKEISHMSGMLHIQVSNGVVRPFKFEGAYQTIRFGPLNSSNISAQQAQSQLTFTGLEPLQQEVQEALTTCLWQPLPPGWTQYSAAHWPFYVHHATGVKQWQHPTASVQPNQFKHAPAEPAKPTQTHDQPELLQTDTAKPGSAAGKQASTESQNDVSSTSQIEASLPDPVSTSLSMAASAVTQQTDPEVPWITQSLLRHATLQHQGAYVDKQGKPSKAKRTRPDSNLENVQTRPRKLAATALRCSEQDWAAASSSAFPGTLLAT